MLYSVTGIVKKLSLPQVTVDVHGVGYLITVPFPLWDELQEGLPTTLTLFTYVREDRLDLFGFASASDRALFAALLGLSGIGPKSAMEICSAPRNLLSLAVQNDDVSVLTKIKGIGKKTAEKLLVDLKQLFEKHPEWAALHRNKADQPAAYDDDAIGALVSLGYDRSTVLEALKKIPPKLKRTEDRVAAALRSL